MSKRVWSAAVVVVSMAVASGGAIAQAQERPTQPSAPQYGYGWGGGMGPGMMRGPGVGPGPGMMGGWGPGMGQGTGSWTPGMGPGMMGGWGPGMGPGMTGGWGPGMGPGFGPGAGMGRGMMMGPSDGWGADGWTQGYGPFAALDLTDEQRQKVASIQEENRRRTWDAMGQLQAERFKLRQMFYADKMDPTAVFEQQRRVDELRRQLLKSRVEARNQIAAALTPDQRQRLRSFGPSWIQDIEQ